MAIKDVASGRTDMYKLDPRIIQIKKDWNNRDLKSVENQQHIAELKASIKEIGVKRPLICYQENEVVYTSDGHCRLTAVMELIKEGVEIKTVPVLVEDRHANEADRIFTQIIHNQGKPLTSLEQAKVFKRLLDLGWKNSEISLRAGLSPSRVSQLLELLTLPEPVKAMVSNGQVSAGMALKVVKENGGSAVEKLNNAVSAANAEGKVRALPKHTGERKPNAAKVVKDIIEATIAEGRFDESEELVTISFTDDDWASILEVLNL
jgi:ParB/RepB/Spo0J family partition protein